MRLLPCGVLVCCALSGVPSNIAHATEDWIQVKFDARRSGDAADRTISARLGLLAAVPLRRVRRKT